METYSPTRMTMDKKMMLSDMDLISPKSTVHKCVHR